MVGVIVLDIDETLAHTKLDVDELRHSGILESPEYLELRRRLYALDFYRKNGSVKRKMWGIKRPYIDVFLDFCFRVFDRVIIWSAGSKDYVDKMVKILFMDAGHPPPHHVFSFLDCKEMEDGDHVKPIMFLYALEPSLQKIPLNHFIMIDNKESNFIYNMENGLVIDDYAPNTTIDDLFYDDKQLLYAIDHLKLKIRDMIRTRGIAYPSTIMHR